MLAKCCVDMNMRIWIPTEKMLQNVYSPVLLVSDQFKLTFLPFPVNKQTKQKKKVVVCLVSATISWMQFRCYNRKKDIAIVCICVHLSSRLHFGTHWVFIQKPALVSTYAQWNRQWREWSRNKLNMRTLHRLIQKLELIFALDLNGNWLLYMCTYTLHLRFCIATAATLYKYQLQSQ